MEFMSNRFGTIEVNEEEIITFHEGLPGLENLNRFVLLDEQEIPMLHWLQSIEDPDIVLPLLNVFDVCDSYVVDIDDQEVMELGNPDVADLMVMNVVVIPEEMMRMTANLAAPVLINTRQHLGKQILLMDAKYSTRYPIFDEFCRVLKKGA